MLVIQKHVACSSFIAKPAGDPSVTFNAGSDELAQIAGKHRGKARKAQRKGEVHLLITEVW